MILTVKIFLIQKNNWKEKVTVVISCRKVFSILFLESSILAEVLFNLFNTFLRTVLSECYSFCHHTFQILWKYSHNVLIVPLPASTSPSTNCNLMDIFTQNFASILNTTCPKLNLSFPYIGLSFDFSLEPELSSASLPQHPQTSQFQIFPLQVSDFLFYDLFPKSDWH